GSAPLRPGGARDISFVWDVLPNGDQRLQCVPPGTLSLALGMEPALYVDAANGEWGELRLPCPVSLVRQYWNAPPVSPEQVRETNAHIEQAARDASSFPLLRELTIEKRQSTSL